MLVDLDLAALEEHIRKWKGPLILAGDFNAKARAWTEGPWDPRGDLVEELMGAYNLVVANKPGVHTYEKEIARLVLRLIFASPEVTKNISSWEVLDAESLSDHRYISTKLLGKKNQRRRYKTKGGWFCYCRRTARIDKGPVPVDLHVWRAIEDETTDRDIAG